MQDKLIHWHKSKHPLYKGENLPINQQSTQALNALTEQILNPLERVFGEVIITYGFTTLLLLKYIKKNSPGDMAPELDQHAALEVNSRGTRICKRDGAACDIYIKGYENQMHLIAQHVINELPFDRLYYYGKDRPIHISYGPDNARYLHVKERDKQGKRNLGKGAKGDKAITLLAHSI